MNLATARPKRPPSVVPHRPTRALLMRFLNYMGATTTSHRQHRDRFLGRETHLVFEPVDEDLDYFLLGRWRAIGGVGEVL